MPSSSSFFFLVLNHHHVVVVVVVSAAVGEAEVPVQGLIVLTRLRLKLCTANETRKNYVDDEEEEPKAPRGAIKIPPNHHQRN